MTANEMERRECPVLHLTPDDAASFSEGTTLDVDTGMRAHQPAGGALLLYVSNAGASPGIVTIRSGHPDFAPLCELGDFIVSIPVGESRFIGPLNPNRFSQTDGSIWIDGSPELAGRIAAYAVRMPESSTHDYAGPRRP
jgi:hypothetical protein